MQALRSFSLAISDKCWTVHKFIPSCSFNAAQSSLTVSVGNSDLMDLNSINMTFIFV